MSKGKLFIISGCSGVGKGTVLKQMLKARNDLLFSVSATTRDPRPGEVDGTDYSFITRTAFEDMIQKGEFLEYDEHNATYYGTPRAQIEEKMTRGLVLLDIEPKGAAQVIRSDLETELIFIMPPSMEVLEHRLRSRGDTSEEQIKMRMERAAWEMEQRSWYDHVVVNDEVERCAKEILEIIAEKAD